ncbi:MAG: fluoride efflux transporter CrcB [Bacteroides sp.]|nr:fluoride efflux transporter CrcB [Bacteroides sp.]MCM1378862.1 fluoride efflux transporter CrcB [Bacteroides sp.]MCM1445478.1 fluoride efflux transporter CrcB [Prevotella sp.]
MLIKFIAIFLGGGLGSTLRYATQLLLHERITPYHFPWATFTVNIVGSFLIGLFYALSAKLNLSNELRLLLTAGLCGGFTTYSTFSNDILMMLRQGDTLTALIYIALSLLMGILACLLGSVIISPK